MKINSINDSNISGIKLIELNKFCDNRGYFSETYRSTDFSNNNLKFPGKEITMNMAPADIRKEGSVFDLPIAIGILAASEQVESQNLDKYILIGELSLIRSCSSVLA